MQQKFTNSCTPILIQMKKFLTLFLTLTLTLTIQVLTLTLTLTLTVHVLTLTLRKGLDRGRQWHLPCGLERNEDGAMTSRG